MAKRPNILLVLSDQLRADSLGCYGHPFALTPAIDRLAASGTFFRRAYTPSPECVSARSSLITGLSPDKGGCYDNGFPMPEEPPTLMSLLSEAGYRTHGVGKMHFTPDPLATKGFQTREVGEEFGTPEHDDYLRFVSENGFAHVERPHGLRDEMYYVPQLSQVPEHLHPSRWVADRSITFLQENLPKEELHPHPPFAPPSPWHRLYEPSLMPEPDRPPGEPGLLTVHNLHQNRYKFRDGVPHRRQDRRLVQLIRAYYLACVSFVDYQVGRILSALSEAGPKEETLVIFCSDHGEFLGDYGSWGKRSFLDPAARVPLVVSGPGFDHGSWAEDPVSLLDILPTVLSAADLERGGLPFDGASLLDGATLREREAIFGQFQTGPLGLYYAVTRSLKWAYSAADRREYLLDLVRDPNETRNLAYNPRAREDLLFARGVARRGLAELSDLDLDEAARNFPVPLGGQPTPERFVPLPLDEDAALLPRTGSSPPNEPPEYFGGHLR